MLTPTEVWKDWGWKFRIVKNGRWGSNGAGEMDAFLLEKGGLV